MNGIHTCVVFDSGLTQLARIAHPLFFRNEGVRAEACTSWLFGILEVVA